MIHLKRLLGVVLLSIALHEKALESNNALKTGEHTSANDAYLNPSGKNPNVRDIIGAYRALSGKPISWKLFLSCKELIDSHGWGLKELGRYFITLPEVQQFLDLPWNPKPVKLPLLSANLNGDSSIEKKYNLFNKPDFMTDNDIIGAYRVITGKPISQNDFSLYTNARNHGLKYQTLASSLISYEDSLENLQVPLLTNDALTYALSIPENLTIFGFKTDLVIAKIIKDTGHWEPYMETLISKTVNPGDYVIDVGANIGYFSALMAKWAGDKGHVFAFEPVPPIAATVQKMKEFNKLSNLTIYTLALSNQKGKVFIAVNTISPGISKFTSPENARIRNQKRPGSVVTVPTITLDELIRNEKIERCNYIKIDVEGAEDLVLNGARSTIKRFLPKITWEFNLGPYRDKGVDPLPILQWLASLGYKIAPVIDVCHAANLTKALQEKAVTPLQLISKMDKLGLIQLDIYLSVV